MQLEEIIINGLEGNEYVSMLSWIVNTYSGPELMQHPDLNIDIGTIGPLLNVGIINDLQQQYLKVILRWCLVKHIVIASLNSLYKTWQLLIITISNSVHINYRVKQLNYDCIYELKELFVW